MISKKLMVSNIILILFLVLGSIGIVSVLTNGIHTEAATVVETCPYCGHVLNEEITPIIETTIVETPTTTVIETTASQAETTTTVQTTTTVATTISSVETTTQTTVATIIDTKSNEELAYEVMRGIWGNGNYRKIKLDEAGYNYYDVQDIVNRLVRGEKVNTSVTKTIGADSTVVVVETSTNNTDTVIKRTNEEIAAEVLNGQWGNGSVRKRNLTDAGYDYSDIQAIVNEEMSNRRGSRSITKIASGDTVITIGSEVIDNDYEEYVSDDSYTTSSVSDSDFILLCNCVAHEAGSNWISTYNKALVVEVVMNRVYSSSYPDTVYGVITQKGQFSGCWNYADLGTYSSKVTQDVKDAVNMYFDNPSDFNHGYTGFWGDGKQNHFR